MRLQAVMMNMGFIRFWQMRNRGGRESMKKISSCYEFALHWLVVGLSIMILGLLWLGSLFQTVYVDMNEYSWFHHDSVILHMGILCLLGLLCFVWKPIAKLEKYKKIIWIFVLTLYAVLLVAFVLYLHIPVRADQLYVMNAAVAMRNGDFSAFQLGGYIQMYQNQIGMTYFAYILTFIPVSMYTLFRLVNCIAILGTVYCFYVLGNLLFEEKKKRYIYGYALMAFLPVFLYVTFLYGNSIAMACSLVGVCSVLKYIKSRKWLYGILAMVALAFSLTAKQNFLIQIIAVVLLLIWDMCKKKNIKTIGVLLGILVSCFLLNTAVECRLQAITGVKLQPGMPAIAWVTMGTQEGYMAAGWYNNYSKETFEKNHYDAAATKKVAKEDLKERLQELLHRPGYTVKFYYKKVASQWLNPSFEGIWINDLSKHEKEHPEYKERTRHFPKWLNQALREPGNPVIVQFLNVYQSLVYLGCILWLLLKGRKAELPTLLGMIIFLGGFFFHILWEGKCQYVLPYYIILLPYAIQGYIVWKNWSKHIIEEKKGRNAS